MGKQRISATIDAALKDRLDAKTELNKSQLIESLLSEYLAQGESTTVALQLLRSDLRRKRDNKQVEKRMVENEIDSLEDQIEEVSQKIRERREAGLEGIEEIVQQVEDDDLNPEYIDADNPIIQEQASRSGVPPARYAEEVHDRL